MARHRQTQDGLGSRMERIMEPAGIPLLIVSPMAAEEEDSAAEVG